ncbi:hypothetical protein B5E92_05390 [Erysipelatoclostridium sp. An15]|uniref:flavodoxin n=1 Tax=unclassified Thomasclavelia TaxID=3025756 RepID=UPI000B3803E2|nr:flavodoxin [Erysipelatoclostridium sp. An15]OUQ08005.1 hypothetical protein B5E92_05390 [Erysipelatoclostridium sp. An15]
MKKFLLALLVMLVFVTGCSSNNQSNNDESSGNTNESQDATNDQTTTTEDSNILIAYFSKTGNTEAIAQEIQSLTNGTLVEIETVEPYPDSYSETVDIAESEKEANARPEISTTVDNMDQYDTIFIGYPIWWYTYPQVILTFFDNYDLTGKTIVPFVTHGGSGMSGTEDDMREYLSDKDVTVLDGLAVSRNDIEEDQSQTVTNWLEELGFIK